MLKTHNCGDLRRTHAGELVTLAGWVHRRRDHGSLIFLDLRDRSGLVQVVINPKNAAAAHQAARDVRTEYVLQVQGKVSPRPKGSENPALPSGEVEVVAQDLHVLSAAKTTPFYIYEDSEIDETLRFKYRYLDLRRQRLQSNLVLRHKVVKLIRDFLDARGFLEIETPSLIKSTPEGARDYLVPSRLNPGTFYALPQSPQQLKQLLMVAGYEKYFQIARCFRDEDQRADRQPEFTQLDLEMSFVEREDVMAINEQLLIEIVTRLFPDKRIKDVPFPRLSYREAQQRYGTDRPDLRTDKADPHLLAFCWVIDFPFFERTEEGGWTFTHNPFSAPKPEFMADLLNKRNIEAIITNQYDVVLNGTEIGGGSIRNHEPDALEAVFSVMGYEPDRIREQFGHMLEAFGYGAPPHGGIAWGLDRLVMILCGESSIREVIAFPKTQTASDLMMGSPSPVTPQQLAELHLKVIETKK